MMYAGGRGFLSMRALLLLLLLVVAVVRLTVLHRSHSSIQLMYANLNKRMHFGVKNVTAPPSSIQAPALYTTAPPSSIQASALYTTAPPSSIQAPALHTTAPPPPTTTPTIPPPTAIHSASSSTAHRAHRQHGGHKPSRGSASTSTANALSPPSPPPQPELHELRRQKGCGGACQLRLQRKASRSSSTSMDNVDNANGHDASTSTSTSTSDDAREAYKALWKPIDASNATAGPLGTPIVDDGTCASSPCTNGGVCQNARCVCPALFEGERCESQNSKLPNAFSADLAMHPQDPVDVLFNSRRRSRVGAIPYRTNPKLGTGETHRFYATLNEETMGRVPTSDPTKGLLWQSCAVVGSSGMLRRYRLGKEIDSHSLVIRFNRAPTRHFERHAGRMTHLRFVNTNNAQMREHSGEVVVQQMQSQTGFSLYVRSRHLRPYDRLFAFDPTFSKFVSAQTKYLPTGGYFAVWFALLKCASVTMYGFYSQSNAGTEKSVLGAELPHHYYDNEKPSHGKRAIHDYAGERQALGLLNRARLVTIAEPCSWGCDSNTGRECTRCGSGARCECGGPPWPVAKPGFCRLHASRSRATTSFEIASESLCFVSCGQHSCSHTPHGSDACPHAVERALGHGRKSSPSSDHENAPADASSSWFDDASETSSTSASASPSLSGVCAT